MLLIDALYINNMGGKVLLDYLIEELEKTNLSIVYLLDLRIKKNHPTIKPSNKVLYCNGSVLNRFYFYKNIPKSIEKVLCFANLPPIIKLDIIVYTYFHQKLFLEISNDFNISEKILLRLKSFFLKNVAKNTDFWLVQTRVVKKDLLQKVQCISNEKVLSIPFYSSNEQVSENVSREKNSFLYVSGGSAHKNHLRLLEAFAKHYEANQIGKLYLTIGSEFPILQKQIIRFIERGIPIINVGFLNKLELKKLYCKSEFLIFPSLTESFGLGILEAIENGCKVIGADLPYTHALCTPSLIFDPINVESIENAFFKACFDKVKPTEQLVFNEIRKLIALF